MPTLGPCTHFLNADFDLRLRPRPRQIDDPRLTRQVRELTALALVGAAAEDAVLLCVDVPADYRAYLARRGVEPEFLAHPAIRVEDRFRPFAWTAAAVALNARHTQPQDHPSADCLRRVNGRRFSQQLERELFPATARSLTVASVEEFEHHLAAAPAAADWVIKSEYGNASLANLRLRHDMPRSVGRRFVAERLAEDDCVIVEPWFDRQRDAAVVFDVPFTAGSLRIHETMHTRDGAPLASLFGPADPEDWSEPLSLAAQRVAERLNLAGYFGPVCMDAFTFHQDGQTVLRPLVELNCRHAMSDAAYRFWRRHAPERWLCYRMATRRKYGLPDDFAELEAALTRFDDRGRVLVASPPVVVLDGERTQPFKLAMIFTGETRDEVLALDRAFRARFQI